MACTGPSRKTRPHRRTPCEDCSISRQTLSTFRFQLHRFRVTSRLVSSRCCCAASRKSVHCHSPFSVELSSALRRSHSPGSEYPRLPLYHTAINRRFVPVLFSSVFLPCPSTRSHPLAGILPRGRTLTTVQTTFIRTVNLQSQKSILHQLRSEYSSVFDDDNEQTAIPTTIERHNDVITIE